MCRYTTLIIFILFSFNTFAISQKDSKEINTTIKDFFNSQKTGDHKAFEQVTSKEFRNELGKKNIKELFTRNKGRKKIKKINLKIEKEKKKGYVVKLPYHGLEDIGYLVIKNPKGKFIIQEQLDHAH